MTSRIPRLLRLVAALALATPLSACVGYGGGGYRYGGGGYAPRGYSQGYGGGYGGGWNRGGNWGGGYGGGGWGHGRRG